MKFNVELTEEEMSVALDALEMKMYYCAEYHCEQEFLFTKNLDDRLRKIVIDKIGAEPTRTESNSEF